MPPLTARIGTLISDGIETGRITGMTALCGRPVWSIEIVYPSFAAGHASLIFCNDPELKIIPEEP
jgi:hypothetical protein